MLLFEPEPFDMGPQPPKKKQGWHLPSLLLSISSFRREDVEVLLLFRCRLFLLSFKVEIDHNVIAQHVAAFVQSLVPVNTKVFPIDFGGSRETSPVISPRIIGFP